MGKLTISMAIFNSYVKLPEGKNSKIGIWDDCSLLMFIEYRSLQKYQIHLNT